MEMAPRLSPKLWICHSGISQMVSDIVPRLTSALGQKSTRERAFELVQRQERRSSEFTARTDGNSWLVGLTAMKRCCAFPTYAA